jgi:hypothetical protein
MLAVFIALRELVVLLLSVSAAVASNLFAVSHRSLRFFAGPNMRAGDVTLFAVLKLT